MLKLLHSPPISTTPSGKKYLYQLEEWEEEEAALLELNPIVLEKERKLLWSNLKTLEESLAALTEKVLGLAWFVGGFSL